ncbi:hypothetical protein NST23_25170 [Brevibacillus sp. FSL K6-0770]|uniref:hypothetical protein n=1 Tax=Brevibacillus TaxID=55080 RepID=UPI001C21766D|nr:hypothetical protein [Brevibacillus parabrevis]MBU8715919.1 hypothetical protein [Brevibacillus parabrevis]
MPHQMREECVRLPKIYDWVLTTSYSRSRLPVPEPFFTQLKNCLQSGMAISVSCLPPDDPCTCAPIRCHLHAPLRRTFHIVGGQRVPIAVARFIVEATVSVLFFADGDLLFELPVPLALEEQAAISLPPPLDLENISCRIAAAECRADSALLPQMGLIEIDAFACLEMVVEAPAVLQVMGRHCTPRSDSIPVPPRKLPLSCTPFRLPPNCPRLTAP